MYVIYKIESAYTSMHESTHKIQLINLKIKKKGISTDVLTHTFVWKGPAPSMERRRPHSVETRLVEVEAGNPHEFKGAVAT